MHGLIKVDRVEAANLIIVLLKQMSRLRKQSAFWISDEIRSVKLHQVRLHKISCFTGTGTADHDHIQITVKLKIKLGAL